MKLSKNSWHYLLFDKTYERNAPDNLCPYFWSVFWAILCLPFNFVFTLPLTITYLLLRSKEIDRPYEREYFSDQYGFSFAYNFCLALIFCMVYMWFVPYEYKPNKVSLVWIIGIIGYGIIFFVLCFLGINAIHKYNRKKKRKVPYVYKEDAPNIFTEFVKAKYKRYCPKIEWQSKSVKHN